MTKRNYLFDNLKVFLIFLVVFGHLIAKYIDNNMFFRNIYFLIFSFHMPLFIYISGYFSKNVDKCKRTAIKNFLIPFLVLNTLWWIGISIVTKSISLQIYIPYWALWYLSSLFCFRYFLKDLIKIKHIIFIVFLIGVLSILIRRVNMVLNIQKTLTFLPYFLLGYYSNGKTIAKIKSIPKIISFVGAIALSIFIFYIVKINIVDWRFLLFQQSYKTSNLSLLQGILYTSIFYIISILLCVFVINLMSDKENITTKLGQSTLMIFLGHMVLVQITKQFTLSCDTSIMAIFFILYSFLCIFIFSRPIVSKTYYSIFKKAN